METEQINQQVLKLWEQTFSSDADVLIPLIYPTLTENAILFVGLNPSFGEKFGFLRDTAYSEIKLEEFFHWRNRKKVNPDIAKGIENEAKKRYAFYAKFREIAEEARVAWEHIDLFFYRETSQQDFKESIYNNTAMQRFVRSQLELSKQLIVGVKPRVIVVANAFASEVFAEQFSTEFDENVGCHKTQLMGRSVPTFLGSMLTGQRAMDVYSYQRLKWQIKQLLKVL